MSATLCGAQDGGRCAPIISCHIKHDKIMLFYHVIKYYKIILDSEQILIFLFVFGFYFFTVDLSLYFT